MGKNKMIAKSCPKCEMQLRNHSSLVAVIVNVKQRFKLDPSDADEVAVASKSCKCGHTFFAARRGADNLPAAEDLKRRTGRVRRSRTQFYDAQHYQKQRQKRSPKKRSLSRSLDYDYKGKEKESATAVARRRRALRRARRSPPRGAGPERRERTPQLRPAQLARCRLILHEINRKLQAVTWTPPA